jgi:hypothetical protein
MGAVATTFMAGVESIRKNLAAPIGSLTQMGTVRLGKRTDKRAPLIKDFVPLAKLDDLVFGGWDLFKDNGYEAAAELLACPDAALAADLACLTGPHLGLLELARRLNREVVAFGTVAQPIPPESVARYLHGKFGDALADVRAAMERLARSLPPERLAVEAFHLYEEFRPEVPAGVKGWGVKGTLDIDRILALAG